MNLIIGIVISYFIGSVPTAYIFGKALKGLDIRKHGSGNVGATNVFRVLGKGPGIAVLILDILKGVLAVALVADLLGLTTDIARIFLGVAVVCGHNWTVFLQFKGGKGIATSLGVLIGFTIRMAVLRMVLLSTVSIWLISFLLTGFVSLSSIVAATFLPILMVLTNQNIELVILGIVFCVFVVIRHRPNIKKLLSGQENRVMMPYFKKKAD